MYQRHYKWEKEQVEELLEDLEAEMLRDPKEEHALFLGTLVFESEGEPSKRTTYLLDGQQRLFTLALIQMWWIRRLLAINTQSSGVALQQLKALIFNEKVKDIEALDTAQIRELVRLQPALHDATNFEGLVRRGKAAQKGRPTRLIKAARQIHERFESTLNRLAKEKRISVDPDSPDFQELVVEMAERMYEVLDQRVVFGVIEVSPPFNAFSIFEGLNSKGLELAQSDLIKNYMLSKLGTPKLREQALQQWDAMVNAMPGDRVVEFLRAWYIAYHAHIQKSELYNAFKPRLSEKESIKECLDDWQRTSWWFRALVDGRIHDNHESMAGVKKSEEFTQALRDWGKLGFKQGNAVILALLHEDVCDPTKPAGQARLARGMRLLEAAYVRLFVTANVRGSTFENKLELMCDTARKKKDTALDSLASIIQTLCTDNKVGGVLDWTGISRNVSEARFLLYRIVETQAGAAMQLAGSDLWHVEHIRPQTKDGPFANDEEKEAYEESVGQLGNLTLLLQGDNTSLGNQPHKEKVKIYKLYNGETSVDTDGAGNTVPRPHLPLNLDVAKKWPEKWDEVSIDQRGKLMGTYATGVWTLEI